MIFVDPGIRKRIGPYFPYRKEHTKTLRKVKK